MSNLSPAKAGSKNHLGRVSWGSLRSPQALRCRLRRRLLNLAPHENKLGKNLPTGSLEEIKYSPKIFGLFLIALFACHVEAKSWRGITPGRSTRDEVARKLNQTVGVEPRFNYQSSTEDILFVFSSAGGNECLRGLPSGTVLEIIIHPRVQFRFKDSELNTDRLKQLTISSSFYIIGTAYFDEEDGFVIKILDGLVREIIYTANKSDRHLCEGYYSSLERFC